MIQPLKNSNEMTTTNYNLEYSINMDVEAMFQAIQLGIVTSDQFVDWVDEIKDLQYTNGVYAGQGAY